MKKLMTILMLGLSPLSFAQIICTTNLTTLTSNVVVSYSVPNITCITNSPPPTNSWATLLGGGGTDQTLGIAQAADGSVYAVGVFAGSATLAGTTLVSAGAADAWVAKLSSTGTVVWARRLGGTGDDRATGVTVDSQGNAVVVGYFQGSADLGTGNVTALGSYDAFVIKYAAEGGCLWAKRFGGAATMSGASGDDRATFVTVDAADNIIVGGYFDGKPNWGGADLTATAYDGFVAKLTSSGTHVWSKNLRSSSYDFLYAGAVDAQSNVVVVGSFQGSLDLTTNWASYVTSAGAYDSSVIKFSGSTGALQWAKRIGSVNSDVANGVAVDQRNNDIVLTGYFRGTVDFGTVALSSIGTGDNLFLARYSTSGAPLWARVFGASASSNGRGVAIDSQGVTHLTGLWAGTANFGTGSLGSVGGLQDVLVLRLTDTGSVTSVKTFGGSNNDNGLGIAVGTGGVVVGGVCRLPATLCGTAFTNTVYNDEAFIGKP